MACETMAQTVCRDMLLNSSPFCTFTEELNDTVLHKIIARPWTWKQNPCWSAAFKPVFCKYLKCTVSKQGITVKAAFAITDVYCFIGAWNVIIVKVCDFWYPKTTWIHCSNHGPMFQVWRCIQNRWYLCFRKHGWQVPVSFHTWDIIVIPIHL